MAYFLSPDSPFGRSPNYPKVASRIKQVLIAARHFRRRWGKETYTLPSNLTNEFHNSETDPLDQNEWQTAIDEVAEKLVPFLLNQIFNLAKRKSWQELRGFSVKETNRICKTSFKWAVPATNAKFLANILNAAWAVELNSNFWRNLPSFRILPEKERRTASEEALRELVLKNIEVLEYEDRLEGIITDA